MKRTSLFLDDRIMAEVKRLAGKRGVSVATVVREALASYVAEPAKRKALPSIAGRFSSGKRDTSSRVDELLWRHPHR
jgi:hypothetical protein